jgi:hypothetical protein
VGLPAYGRLGRRPLNEVTNNAIDCSCPTMQEVYAAVRRSAPKTPRPDYGRAQHRREADGRTAVGTNARAELVSACRSQEYGGEDDPRNPKPPGRNPPWPRSPGVPFPIGRSREQRRERQPAEELDMKLDTSMDLRGKVVLITGGATEMRSQARHRTAGVVPAGWRPRRPVDSRRLARPAPPADTREWAGAASRGLPPPYSPVRQGQGGRHGACVGDREPGPTRSIRELGDGVLVLMGSHGRRGLRRLLWRARRGRSCGTAPGPVTLRKGSGVKIVLLVAVLAATLFVIVAAVLERLWCDRHGRPRDAGAGPSECGPGVNRLRTRRGSDSGLADRPAQVRTGGPDRLRRPGRRDTGSRRPQVKLSRVNRFGGQN